jgi:hypothetical protein
MICPHQTGQQHHVLHEINVRADHRLVESRDVPQDKTALVCHMSIWAMTVEDPSVYNTMDQQHTR